MVSHPQQSQNRLQIPAPNFPLSSPITEEVPSPTSTASDDRELERTRPFEFLAKMTAQDSLSSRTRPPYPVDEPRQAERNPSSGANPTKRAERPVGLNLVTDFSRPTPQPRPDAPFVDLNDLKVLSKVREKERSAQTLKGILKKGPSHGFQRLPDDPDEVVNKKRASWFDVKSKISPRRNKYKDDLSPSDRPIMIGFSMPRDDETPPHQHQAQSHKDRSKELDSAGSQPTPLTPSIIVTPARDDNFWPDFSQIHHHPRATSSIYSQPTPLLESRESGIPPVPAIPAQHAAAKNEILSPATPNRQSALSTRKLRAYSTGTVFEEDEHWRPATRSRSYSSESAKRAFDRLSALGTRGGGRLSVVSDSNRPVSQGWWTYLLSPLLDRSNTFSSRKTPTEATRPPLPTPTTQHSGLSDEWWEKEVSCFSPDTPETAAPRGEVASWQNETNPFADEKRGLEGETGSPAEAGPMSFVFMGKTIQGCAAEYYQACAHELFSKTPYFECVNHVCSITPKDVARAQSGVLVAGDADAQGSRGILVDVDDPPESENRGISDADSATGSRGMFGGAPSTKAPESPVGTPKDSGSKRSTGADVKEAPAPAPAGDTVDDRGDWEKSPPAQPASEKQAPFPFILPNGAPPGTQVYVQSAPTPSAPVVGTERSIPHYIVVQPPNYTAPAQAALPTSPGLQRATEQGGSIPLDDMQGGPAPAYTYEPNDGVLPPRMEPLPITREAMTHPVTERERIETRRRRLEKEDRIGRKAGGLWRGRGCFSNKGCFGRPGREGRLRRRWYVAIAAFFLAIVVVAVVLAILLTRRGDNTPVESQWLNLTGYPPMPTGISTIAGPEAKVQNSGCITPSTLWSCALPQEQHSANQPYAANQPNFRVEIRFQNGTYPNSTAVASKTVTSRGVGELFNPSPAAPDLQDQEFLGNTTDNNTVPYAGEVTPFFMTMLSPVKVSSLTRRSDSNNFPDIGSLIPSPAHASDGTAAAATLYPLPESQPVRLYNRGLATEHYGFYTYFDRSIFLESRAPLDGGSTDDSKSDATGGPSKANAQVRCTWAQTRFLVQIWTRPAQAGMALLAAPTPTTTAQATSTAGSRNATSSATDFVRPGSFPYPVTITLDRHGGVAKEKMVYCYGMETAQRINATEKKLQIEDRGFGGVLVNPAPGIFNLTGSDADAKGSWGGVDGGTGGIEKRRMPQLTDHTISLLRLGHGAQTHVRRAWEGFVNFAARDNVLEVALGLIIAQAFTKVVTSFVSDIILPIISLLPFLNRNMDQKFAVLMSGPRYVEGEGYNTLTQARDDGALVLAYGYYSPPPRTPPFSSHAAVLQGLVRAARPGQG
ncbi:hypothetical protein HFD88_005078 [Aspergillus terreus]|nr:hypothetical protein HFD88_005078 [Aspergillus terreus]